MNEEKKSKISRVAGLYFNDYSGERPFELWRSFDKTMAKDLSVFITGDMYAREVLPHPTRQLVAVAALMCLDKAEELRLHIHAALNVGCQPKDIAETMFQCAIYAGIPAMNQGLKVLREALISKEMWPLDPED